MACDIHVHTEVKIEGQWRHYGTPDVARNYELFEKMAGVRGAVENAIIPPKGLPCDATFETKFDAARWGVDGHSHSWLSHAEIKKLCAWFTTQYPKVRIETYFGFLYGNSWKELPAGVTNIRLVFWFDR